MCQHVSFSLTFMSRQRRLRRCTVTQKSQSMKFQFFRLSVFQNPLSWPKWNSHHIRNLIDSDSSVFGETFLHSFHIFIHFAWRGHPECSQSSTDIIPLLNLENHSQNCVLPLICSLTATSDILSVACAHALPPPIYKCVTKTVWCGTSHKHTNIHNFYSVKYYKHFTKQHYRFY